MSSRTVTLGSIAKITSGGTPDRMNANYWNGTIPWVKTAQIQNCTIAADDVDEWITEEGLAQSSARRVPKGTILMAMYGQGKTRGQVAILGLDATINQACAALFLHSEADRDYVYQQLRFRYEAIRNLSNIGSQENLNAEIIREIAFPLPPLQTQKYIAQALTSWDAAIETAKQLIAAKEWRLACLRERLLRQAERGLLTKLGAITHELSERNGIALGRAAIMAVTKEIGMRPMREETIASSIERYKVVPPRAFAYNPMRLNIGSIAMSPFQSNVLVSPDYVVFACNESRLLPGYLNHLRHSRIWKSHFGVAGNGSVRVRIYYDDLGSFSLRLPSIHEQADIVRVLDAAAQEVALLEEKAEALRKQKRGLMQKLLTGQWRLPLPEEEAV